MTTGSKPNKTCHLRSLPKRELSNEKSGGNGLSYNHSIKIPSSPLGAKEYIGLGALGDTRGERMKLRNILRCRSDQNATW